jgi:hypothetical protein
MTTTRINGLRAVPCQRLAIHQLGTDMTKNTIQKMGYKPGVEAEYDENGKLVRVIDQTPPKKPKLGWKAILAALVAASLYVLMAWLDR